MNRALLNMAELKAMAFPRSSLLSTISTTNDWRTVVSKADAIPAKTLKAAICQVRVAFMRTRANRTIAWSIESDCVQMRSLLRSHLSATTPASAARKKVGS